MRWHTRTVHLREATPEDAVPLARLMGVLGYPTTPEAMRARLAAVGADPDYHTIIAEADGEVRGMVGLRRGVLYEADHPYIQMVALVVDAEYQGSGIGTVLVQEAEAWARAQGAATITLTSGKHRQPAHRFYERLGYELTGLRFVKKLGADH